MHLMQSAGEALSAALSSMDCLLVIWSGPDLVTAGLQDGSEAEPETYDRDGTRGNDSGPVKRIE